MAVTLGGEAVFGTAVRVRHCPADVEVQVGSYFGVGGLTSLAGGGRGRRFEVSGVFVGPDTAAVMAFEASLLSMADGVAREFVDSQGRAWANVQFEGAYLPSSDGPKETDTGWALPYWCELVGLT